MLFLKILTFTANEFEVRLDLGISVRIIGG